MIQDHSNHGALIKGTDESTLVTDSSVSLLHHDPSDLGSLILIEIIPKKRTLRLLRLFVLCTFLFYQRKTEINSFLHLIDELFY